MGRADASKAGQLKELLKELFQMNEPDLDFGLYRIMHQRSSELDHFFDHVLVQEVRRVFSRAVSSGPAEVAGAAESKAPYGKSDVQSAERLEESTFDHLHTFFRRYYKGGDFLPLRRYQAGTYSIPYAGEEVKLHWANADQFYIKSSEHLHVYEFQLGDGAHVRFELSAAPATVGNQKVAKSVEERYSIAANEPFAEVAGADRRRALVVRFEHKRVDRKVKQKELNRLAVANLAETDGLARWKAGLLRLAPTDAEPERTVFEQHLQRFTSRHAFDYFIHKDLGAFLRRELDYYIKNEVLNLDDYLRPSSGMSSVLVGRAVKAIGHKVIAFLAQLEDFQKKLWLKQKFVLDCHYLVPVSIVDEELLGQFVGNADQREQWRELYGVEIVGEVADDWRSSNSQLLLDTGLFSPSERDVLLSSIGALDEHCVGTLVQADNFAALQLFQAKYASTVKCVYIDPPYNTRNDGFVYKDSFRHSSWLSLMSDRLELARTLLRDDGSVFVSIDDNELAHLLLLMARIFGESNIEEVIAWRRRHNQPNDRSKMISKVAEFLVSYSRNSDALKAAGTFYGLPLSATRQAAYSNPDNDSRGPWDSKPWKAAEGQGGSRYKITSPAGEVMDETWLGSKATFEQLESEGLIYFPAEGKGSPRKKYFLSDRMREGQCAHNFWGHKEFGSNQEASAELEAMFGKKKVFDNPKPRRLLESVVRLSTSGDDVLLDYFAGSGTLAEATLAVNAEDGGQRRFLLVEAGEHFDSVLIPRIAKALYAREWKGGLPTQPNKPCGLVKYMRLETYEDTLDNLRLLRTETQQSLLEDSDELREDFFLRYMLDVETRGSDSVLSPTAFVHPFDYTLRTTRGESTVTTVVDLVETFNLLLGLHVDRVAAEGDGLRIVEGSLAGDQVLIIWRDLDLYDNESANDWFLALSAERRGALNAVYMNGDSTLASVRGEGESWRVRSIDSEFHRLMFSTVVDWQI